MKFGMSFLVIARPGTHFDFKSYYQKQTPILKVSAGRPTCEPGFFVGRACPQALPFFASFILDQTGRLRPATVLTPETSMLWSLTTDL